MTWLYDTAFRNSLFANIDTQTLRIHIHVCVRKQHICICKYKGADSHKGQSMNTTLINNYCATVFLWTPLSFYDLHGFSLHLGFIVGGNMVIKPVLLLEPTFEGLLQITP